MRIRSDPRWIVWDGDDVSQKGEIMLKIGSAHHFWCYLVLWYPRSRRAAGLLKGRWLDAQGKSKAPQHLFHRK